MWTFCVFCLNSLGNVHTWKYYFHYSKKSLSRDFVLRPLENSSRVPLISSWNLGPVESQAFVVEFGVARGTAIVIWSRRGVSESASLIWPVTITLRHRANMFLSLCKRNGWTPCRCMKRLSGKYQESLTFRMKFISEWVYMGPSVQCNRKLPLQLNTLSL